LRGRGGLEWEKLARVRRRRRDGGHRAGPDERAHGGAPIRMHDGDGLMIDASGHVAQFNALPEL
jgi:hypothetical protein